MCTKEELCIVKNLVDCHTLPDGEPTTMNCLSSDTDSHHIKLLRKAMKNKQILYIQKASNIYNNANENDEDNRTIYFFDTAEDLKKSINVEVCSEYCKCVSKLTFLEKKGVWQMSSYGKFTINEIYVPFNFTHADITNTIS
jgi:hypothetical protein